MASTRGCLLAASLVLLIASPFALAGPSVCNLPLMVGSWYTGTLSSDVTTSVVTIAVGTRDALFMLTAKEIIYLTSSEWQDNTFRVTEFARVALDTKLRVANPPCGTANTGNYSYESPSCENLLLTVINDNCQERSATMNQLALSLVPRKSLPSYGATCAIVQGDLFRSNGTLTQMSLLFAQPGILQINSTTKDVFFYTAIVTTDWQTLTIRSVDAACNNTVDGVYSMIWLSDCTGFQLRVTSDACGSRRFMLQQQMVKRNYTAPYVKKKRAASDFAGAWSRDRLIGVLIVLVVAIVLMVLMCFMLSASKTQSTSRLDRRRHRKQSKSSKAAAKAAAASQPAPAPAPAAGPNAV